MPAWKEASVRSEGLRNSSPRILPASALRLGPSSRGAAPASSSASDLLAREVRQIEEALHVGQARSSASRSMSTCSSSRMKGGSSRRHVAVARRAREDVALQQLALDLLGRAAGAQPEQEALALVAVTGPTMQVLADVVRRRAARCSSRSSDSMASITASMAAQAMRPAAEGRAEHVQLPGSPTTLADISSAAQGKPLPERLGRGDHVGRDAVEIGGERVADAAQAALHLIEDEQRADRVAARGAAPRDRARPGRTAPPTPCTGSTMTAAVRSVTCAAIAAEVAARHEAHIERRAREAVPALRGAPGDRAGRGRAAVEAVLDRRDLRRGAVMRNAIFSAFSFASAPLLTKNTLVKSSRAKRTSRCGRAQRARRMGTALRLEIAGARLRGERRGPARMAVAERRDGMAAVQIQHAPPVAGVQQPDALGGDHLQRILGEHRREVIAARRRRRRR